MSAPDPDFKAGLSALEQQKSGVNGSFQTLKVSVEAPNVACLELARPSKSNAVSLVMWKELPKVHPLRLRASRRDLNVFIYYVGARCGRSLYCCSVMAGAGATGQAR